MEDPGLSEPPPAFAELIDIIRRLRRPDGCPWDREQTPRSMTRYLIEEAFELADAVESEQDGAVCEELGDVLFQVLFLAEMFAERKAFDLAEVCRRIASKMRRRHPHVFGSVEVADAAEVLRNWQRIKQAERGPAHAASILDAVPAGMSALMRSFAVSERAARQRFDWEDLPAVLAKLGEELAELHEAIARKDEARRTEELGDVFFTLVNVARFCGVHPETALLQSTRKFERRFRALERVIAASGREMNSVPQAEKDEIWERVKSEALIRRAP